MVSCAGTWAAETTGEGGRAKLGSSGPRRGDWSRASYLGEGCDFSGCPEVHEGVVSTCSGQSQVPVKGTVVREAGVILGGTRQVTSDGCPVTPGPSGG